MMYILYASGLYNKRKGIGISQYRLGEESITFASEEDKAYFDGIFNSYKKLDVI
jgi:hypothetical protein